MIDDSLGDEVRVTVIAAGFEGGMPKRREAANRSAGRPLAQHSGGSQSAAGSRSVPAQGGGAEHELAQHEQRSGAGDSGEQEAVGAPRQQPVTSVDAGQRPAARPARPADDELDVPDFLK